MAMLRLIVRRAAELLDVGLVATTRATEGSMVRQAARVLRSRAVLFGTGVWYPPGVIVHLSPPEHARLAPLFSRARSSVAAKVAARLRSHDGGVPEIRVVFDMDPELSAGFAVSALDPMEPPARLTLVKNPEPRREPVANYPTLEFLGRSVRVDPTGVELGRDVSGPGRVTDPTVSARHAIVQLASEGLRITDVGSTNGTWLRGARVSDAGLHHGDELRLGATTIRINWQAEQSTARLVEELRESESRESSSDLVLEWDRLVAEVPIGEDRLLWLARSTGVTFRALDRARRLKKAAASGVELSGDDLRWALQVVSDASAQLREAAKEASA
jgi:hypothetical protein